MERGSRKRFSSAGSEKMERESWWQIGKKWKDIVRQAKELEEMSKGENIVKWIKEQRISWLGHLVQIILSVEQA